MDVLKLRTLNQARDLTFVTMNCVDNSHDHRGHGPYRVTATARRARSSSKSQIAESLGVDRKTIRKYLAPVAAAGLVPGGPPAMSEADWRDRAAVWFPALVDKGLRQVTWPAIGAHRDYITAQLQAGVTVATIHQRLVDEHGLECSVASLRRWVAGNLPEEARRAQVRVLRPGAVEPGSEAQIDYGRLGMWSDPQAGSRHTVWANADGVVLLAAHVCAAGAADGPGGVDPLPR